MKRVLIVGASGFIGSNLAIYLRKKYEVFGTYHRNKISIEGCQMFHLNILDKTEIARIIGSIQPNILIHCAALTDVDYCEKKEITASEINILGTESLVKYSSPQGIQFIYLSDACIYGYDGGPIKTNHELSILGPLNVYSKTKLKGEEKVKEFCVNYQIVRLAQAYGLSGGVNDCFTDRYFEKFNKKKTLIVFSNQYSTPILIDDVGVAFDRIIEDSPPSEVYNLGGPQVINESDFAKLFALIFKYSENLVNPSAYVRSSDHAELSLNSSLNTEKFINRFKYQPLSPEAGIKKLFLQKMMIV